VERDPHIRALGTNATMTGRALAQSLVALDHNAITAP
jgi:hypothetical protein